MELLEVMFWGTVILISTIVIRLSEINADKRKRCLPPSPPTTPERMPRKPYPPPQPTNVQNVSHRQNGKIKLLENQTPPDEWYDPPNTIHPINRLPDDFRDITKKKPK